MRADFRNRFGAMHQQLSPNKARELFSTSLPRFFFAVLVGSERVVRLRLDPDSSFDICHRYPEDAHDYIQRCVSVLSLRMDRGVLTDWRTDAWPVGFGRLCLLARLLVQCGTSS